MGGTGGCPRSPHAPQGRGSPLGGAGRPGCRSRLSPFRPSWRSVNPACPSAQRTVRHFAGLFWWDRSTSKYWGEGEDTLIEKRLSPSHPSAIANEPGAASPRGAASATGPRRLHRAPAWQGAAPRAGQSPPAPREGPSAPGEDRSRGGWGPAGPQTPALGKQSCRHHAVLDGSRATAAAITHSARLPAAKERDPRSPHLSHGCLTAHPKGGRILLPPRAAESEHELRARSLTKSHGRTLVLTASVAHLGEGRYWRYWSLCVGRERREAQGLHVWDNPDSSQRTRLTAMDVHRRPRAGGSAGWEEEQHHRAYGICPESARKPRYPAHLAQVHGGDFGPVQKHRLDADPVPVQRLPWNRAQEGPPQPGAASGVSSPCDTPGRLGGRGCVTTPSAQGLPCSPANELRARAPPQRRGSCPPHPPSAQDPLTTRPTGAGQTPTDPQKPISSFLKPPHPQLCPLKQQQAGMETVTAPIWEC